MYEKTSWIYRLKFYVSIDEMHFCDVIKENQLKFPFNNYTDELTVKNANFSIKSAISNTNDCYDGKISFLVKQGALGCASAKIKFSFSDWNPENYVMLPGCAYKANRFPTAPHMYPPFFTKEEYSKQPKELIADNLLRLNELPNGKSVLYCLSGDMSTPAVCIFDASKKRGMILLFPQKEGNLANTGLCLEENESRDAITISLVFPGVRKERYWFSHPRTASPDISHDFLPNEELNCNFKLFDFPCEDIPALLNRFFDVRKSYSSTTDEYLPQPFSHAFSSIEDRLNLDQWHSNGYYKNSYADENNYYSSCMLGWSGGNVAPYVFTLEGNELSAKRGLENFEHYYKYGQDKSGLLYPAVFNGIPLGDGDREDERQYNLCLTRRLGDALYHSVKTLKIMDDKGIPASTFLKNSVNRFADALCKVWRTEKQFGYRIKIDTAEIIIGGSASGAIIPAALATAYHYFGNKEYLSVALESAEYYFKNFLAKGYTNGGPGEALMAPDSESAFGLLESYVVLYEVTNDKLQLERAKMAASLCASWCTSYDYEFPTNSHFANLRRKTVGSVWANAQNKHAAPGICTLSGNSLFKLYRISGDIRYLQLLQEIARCNPRYLAHNSLPIHGSQKYGITNEVNDGWMCERINMSDWEGPHTVGEIIGGSTWCRYAMLLTYAEIPGIYLQPDTGLLYCFDLVETTYDKNTNELKIYNPTDYSTKVNLFLEPSTNLTNPIFEDYIIKFKKITIEPKKTIIIKLQNAY